MLYLIHPGGYTFLFIRNFIQINTKNIADTQTMLLELIIQKASIKKTYRSLFSGYISI